MGDKERDLRKQPTEARERGLHCQTSAHCLMRYLREKSGPDFVIGDEGELIHREVFSVLNKF